MMDVFMSRTVPFLEMEYWFLIVFVCVLCVYCVCGDAATDSRGEEVSGAR